MNFLLAVRPCYNSYNYRGTYSGEKPRTLKRLRNIFTGGKLSKSRELISITGLESALSMSYPRGLLLLSKFNYRDSYSCYTSGGNNALA